MKKKVVRKNRFRSLLLDKNFEAAKNLTARRFK